MSLLVFVSDFAEIILTIIGFISGNISIAVDPTMPAKCNIMEMFTTVLLTKNASSRILLTFTGELSIVLSGTFVTTNHTLDVLVLVTAVDTVLRVLRRCLPVADERQVRVFQCDRIQVSRERIQIRRWQRVQGVGERVQAGRYRVDQGRFAPRGRYQRHYFRKYYTLVVHFVT